MVPEQQMTPEAAAAILNVDAFATKAEVEKAFAARARLVHPDRFPGGSPGDVRAAHGEFIRVAEAKAVLLSGIAKRAAAAQGGAQYPSPSASRRSGAGSPGSPAGATTPKVPVSFEEFLSVRERFAWNEQRSAAPSASQA